MFETTRTELRERLQNKRSLFFSHFTSSCFTNSDPSGQLVPTDKIPIPNFLLKQDSNSSLIVSFSLETVRIETNNYVCVIMLARCESKSDPCVLELLLLQPHFSLIHVFLYLFLQLKQCHVSFMSKTGTMLQASGTTAGLQRCDKNA